MQQDNNIETLTPVWNDNYVAIAANSSNEYVPYLSVYLESIKANASKDTNYDVIILEQSITDENKKILKETFETEENLSLRFFNPSKIFKNSNLYVSHDYLCKESYFRLCAPIIFSNYDKLIFTDVDLIFNENPHQLFQFDMQNAFICSVLEPIWSMWINRNDTRGGRQIRKYTKEILKLSNPHRYFNTGVMLMDLQKLRTNKIAEECLARLSTKTKYLFQDQDILNEVLGENMGVLPFEWNGELLGAKDLDYANKEFREYCNINTRKIIHWVGPFKPWKMPSRELAYKWWELARRTPFYEQILSKMINSNTKTQSIDNFNYAFEYRTNVLKYWKYKILAKLLIGKKKEHYITKKNIWKQKIRIGEKIRGIKQG